MSSPSGLRGRSPSLFSPLPPHLSSPLSSVPLLSFSSPLLSLPTLLRSRSHPFLAAKQPPNPARESNWGVWGSAVSSPQWVSGQIPLPFLSSSSPSLPSPSFCPSTFLLLSPPPLSPSVSHPFPFSSLPCREAAPKSS